MTTEENHILKHYGISQFRLCIGFNICIVLGLSRWKITISLITSGYLNWISFSNFIQAMIVKIRINCLSKPIMNTSLYTTPILLHHYYFDDNYNFSTISEASAYFAHDQFHFNLKNGSRFKSLRFRK